MSTSSQITRMNYTYNREPMVWVTEILTIEELLKRMDDIDLLPIHQRVDVVNYKPEPEKSKVATKRQGIISSIFKGIDIGEIKINERTADERKKYVEKWESIDGGHRKRTILSFFRSEFKTNPYETSMIGYKSFKELTPEEREMFLSFKIRVVTYKFLSPAQKSMLWATSNNFTPLNEQEQLNGVGDTPLANYIRQLARTDTKIGTECHELFSLKLSPNKQEVIGEWLTFMPNRLTYDRLIARIACIIYNGSKPCNYDDGDIREMYLDPTIDQDRANVMRRKTVEVLNFLLEMAERKYYDIKTKMTEDECIMLIRLWFSYLSDHESFKITNKNEYYDKFRKSWIRFNKDTDDDYAMEFLPAYDNGREERMRWSLFKDNNGKHFMERWLDNIDWIEDRFLDRDGLIRDGILSVKEKRKTLSKVVREQILHNQYNKCYIDGKPLKFKDAHAAHVVPLNEGGSNERANIRMVRAEHNTRMGTMNLEEYKTSWKAKEKTKKAA